MTQANDANPPADGQPPARPTPPQKARPRPGARQAPAILSQTPNLLNLLLCLRRRLVMALSLGVILGAVAAAGAWLFGPVPKHLVKTLLRVPPGSFYVVRTSEVMPDIAMHQRNQVALAKSRLVLTTALRQPAVASLPVLADIIDPVAWLEKEVQVDFSIAPEIMRISISGKETEDLVKLVNAIPRPTSRRSWKKTRPSGWSARNTLASWLPIMTTSSKPGAQPRRPPTSWWAARARTSARGSSPSSSSNWG